MPPRLHPTSARNDLRRQRLRAVILPIAQAYGVRNVRLFGSFANTDLRADDLLRTCLGLRSTMVRLNPF